MKKTNIVQEKSFDFALLIIDVYKNLKYDKKEFVLSKQVLKSGTSIGANIEEAIGGFTEKDFAAKINLAYKESRETSYWLRLLNRSGFINKLDFETLISECDQIRKILASILITLNRKKGRSTS